MSDNIKILPGHVQRPFDEWWAQAHPMVTDFVPAFTAPVVFAAGFAASNVRHNPIVDAAREACDAYSEGPASQRWHHAMKNLSEQLTNYDEGTDHDHE